MSLQKELDVFRAFSNIYGEVVGQIKGIEKLENEVQEKRNKIPGKEYQVNMLQKELKKLKEQNEECNETILQSNLEIEQLNQQATQLFQIIKAINQKIESYQQSCDDFEIPVEVKSKIDEKIDEVIEFVSSECTMLRIDKIKKEMKKLHKERKAIKKEILKLSDFPKDWFPINHFNDIVLEECEMRYSPKDNIEFQSLKSIPIPINDKAPNLMEISCTELPASPQDIDPLQQEIDKMVQTQIDQNHFVNSSYESQAEYLKSLHNELAAKSLTEQDLKKLDMQFQNQVQRMDELTEIHPIQIPNIIISNDDEGSIQIFTEQFNNFVQQIEKDHPYNSLSDAFINTTKESLEIPSFEEPKKMPFIKKPIPSQELVQLADSLKNLIKTANKVESLKQIQESIASQRKLFEENSTKEESQYKDDSANIENDALQIQLVRPLSPPPENLPAIEFKELVKSKIPDIFYDVVDLPDFHLQIEDLPSTGEFEATNQNDEINDDSDSFDFFQNQSIDIGSQSSMSADERSQTFQKILNDFVSFELPQIPHFTPPAPVELRVKPIDVQPLKDQLNNLLENAEEDDSVLIEEINQLESKAQELTIQLKKELLGADYDKTSNSQFSISDIENQVEILELKKSMVEKEKEKTLNKAKEIKALIDEATNEISFLKKKNEEVTISPEMIKQKKDELDELQTDYQNKLMLKLKSMS